MGTQRKVKGHERLFSFPSGTSASLECAHVWLDGCFTKFLWINFYDQAGNEVISACKLLPTNTRWHSCRAIDASTPMRQLLRDLTQHCGRWVRIEFANQIQEVEHA